MEALAPFFIFGVLFLIVLAILWTLLPFAVFGIQPKIDYAIAQIKETNAHLQEIKELLRTDRAAAPVLTDQAHESRVEPT